MSTCDSQIQKKKGLAKVAKDRSISNSLNFIDDDFELENEDLKVLVDSGSSTLPSVLLTFPIPIPYISQDTGDALTQELSVKGASSSCQQSSSPSNSALTTEDYGSSSDPVNIPSDVSVRYVRKDSLKEKSSPSSVENDKNYTSSDQEVCSISSKEAKKDDTGSEVSPKKSFLQSIKRKSSRKNMDEENRINRRSKSPSPSRCQLAVPKLAARSRSLSRLTDIFDNVHHVCLTPTKTADYFEARKRSGRPVSWNTLDHSSFEDDGSSDDDVECQSQESEVSDEISSRRWSSLGHLVMSESSPLYQVKLSEAKQKNYLFGGLGSLLGTTELSRYFPDRNVVIFIATWNMNGKEPPYSLDDFLLPDDMEHMPDMFVIGTQESGGDRTEWEVRLQTSIGPSHVLFHSAVLGILHLTVFLRRDLVWFCSVPEEGYYSLRPGTYFKTKGAIGISFQFFGTKMLFINTHLFAHEEKLQQRIQNYKQIIHNLDLPRNLKCKGMTKPKDVTNRYDVVFWLGDLNFRLVGLRDEILERTKDKKTLRSNIDDILCFDQLNQAKNRGEIFQGFSEGKISFAPTFKFDVGTNHYDSSSKQRVPSYTDRILFKSTRDPVKCTSYGSCPHFKTSDHKPVWGVFHFKVRPGKDDVPLAAGLFQRDVYLTALKRRRRFFHQPSSRNCNVQ